MRKTGGTLGGTGTDWAAGGLRGPFRLRLTELCEV